MLHIQWLLRERKVVVNKIPSMFILSSFSASVKKIQENIFPFRHCYSVSIENKDLCAVVRNIQWQTKKTCIKYLLLGKGLC